ncbi:KilA-N domain-containing protein [Acinetobacter thermotolerans]|uniref:KilA-N domain-containing protein n=1 Tax=Acinetobacter thermotolerans TaxID=3151487 RepID=UPI00325B2283
MSNLTQNFANPNNQPLVIGEFAIRQDEDGRYCLNDLHKASGALSKHKPSFWLRNVQTQDLISELQNSNSQFSAIEKPVNVLRGNFSGGIKQGTYVVKELVYAYAMWVSAKFHLTVIRAYDAMVMQWKINDRKSISPEQQALLHEIVDRRSQGNRKIYAEMWSRHNRHFKIPRYSELLEIHFSESVHYLETMELKTRITSEAKSNLIEVSKNYHLSVQGLAMHMLWLHEWWVNFGESIRKLSPNMASAIHDRFHDGACFAFHFIDKDELKKQKEFMQYFNWHLSSTDRTVLKHQNS